MNNVEKPYKNDPDKFEPLTVGMLKEMLIDLPDNYEIRYDCAMGEIHKGDFTIDHDEKEISING